MGTRAACGIDSERERVIHRRPTEIGGRRYRELVSAPDIDRSVMDQFAALSGDAHLTMVLGAGASAPSGLPMWDEFAHRLAILSGLVKDDSAARTLLSTEDTTIALEATRRASGAKWNAHIQEALYGGLPKAAEPSPLHLAAAGHYLASPLKSTLGTLNFDTLLEQAVLSADSRSVAVDVVGTRHPKYATVHHLHGAVFGSTVLAPVVGYRDFADLVANDGAWQRRFLSDALARGPLLLAGTSYRDPDIRHWLHLILRDEKPTHPAIVTIVREGLKLGRKDFDAIDGALAAEWEAIGLTALRMQDLADVALVLRELRFVGGADYRTPTERARQVWNAHVDRFSELQQDYGEYLADDSAKVTKALGSRAHRASLWLADGRGSLGRWSTQGSRFASPRHLKFVPTGHDSPWIAGEAIGAEEVKLKDVTREPRARPMWRSVLAVPLLVSDGRSPDFATAVLTFGMAGRASTLLGRQDDWRSLIEELSAAWGTRLSGVAFSSRVH